jgi:hypothetical protein
MPEAGWQRLSSLQAWPYDLTQVAVEETEFQVGNDDLRFRRRAGGAASARLPQMTMEQEEHQAQQSIQAAAFLYCQCLQKLLLVSRGLGP